MVSFDSTIGDTLACLVSRFLLREWVQNKFGDRLKTINEGIEREGAFYLFSLRLVPIFPFFVINLLMGLTRMRLFTFFWVSQIGMLAGTVVYVNAGKELAKIESEIEQLSVEKSNRVAQQNYEQAAAILVGEVNEPDDGFGLTGIRVEVEAAELRLEALRTWENPYRDPAREREIAQAAAAVISMPTDIVP